MVLLILLLVFTPLFLVTLYIFRWWWRRRFRVHLTTMFLGMLVAGCLVGLNASPTGIYGIHGISLSDDQFKVRDFYGWPLQVTRQKYWNPYASPDSPDVVLYFCGFLDLLVAYDLISLTAMASEKWIERKQRKKIAA